MILMLLYPKLQIKQKMFLRAQLYVLQKKRKEKAIEKVNKRKQKKQSPYMYISRGGVRISKGYIEMFDIY